MQIPTCGCSAVITTSANPLFGLVLEVGCPCCGAPSGHICGLASVGPRGLRVGEFCATRFNAIARPGRAIELPLTTHGQAVA